MNIIRGLSLNKAGIFALLVSSVVLGSCKDDEKTVLNATHDPSRPIVLESFAPKEVVASDAAHLGIAKGKEVLAFQKDLTAFDLARGRGNQTHQRQRRDAFA